LAPLAAARIPLSSFLFPQSLTPEPHLSAPLLLPSSLPFPLLRSIVRRRNHRRARPPPSSSPPTRANQLRHVESVSQFFFHCGRNIILNGWSTFCRYQFRQSFAHRKEKNGHTTIDLGVALEKQETK
jgi:hypothetical protein